MPSIDDKAQAFTTITAEEVAARAAVTRMQLFPHLERELVKTFGPGPAIFLHQLVYWFDKPKMQNRRWLYKTYKEWRDERGLGRKTVDSARRRLAKLGVLEEKHGPNKRLHYRVDWIKLAELLKLEVRCANAEEDFFEDFDVPEGPEESLHPIGDSDSLHPIGDSSDCTLKGTVMTAPYRGQSNTGDYAGTYAGDYPSVDSLLQSGADALSRATPQEINNDFEDLEERTSPPPVNDKRHPMDGAASPTKTAPRETVDEPPRVEETAPPAPPEPEDAELLAEVREVLDPDSGKWIRFYAESIRKNYGGPGYTAERVAGYLANDPDLPYQGRRAELEPCVRYVFREWANEKQAREVAA